MKKRMTNKFGKIVAGLALAAVIATPVGVGAAQTSADNTITTYKSDWKTSMSDYKTTNTQKTAFRLYSGVGHNNAINYVKVGAKMGGEWTRVIGSAAGYATSKDNVKHSYDLNKYVSAGTQMRIRLKLGSENSGYSADRVANAWYFN